MKIHGNLSVYITNFVVINCFSNKLQLYVVSVVFGGANGGHEMRMSHGQIFIQNWDPLDHRYQTA